MKFILELLFTLLDFILWLLEAVLFYKLLTQFVSPRNGKIIQMLSMIGSFFLVNVAIFPEDIMNVIGAFILFLLMMLICFKDSLIQRTAVVFTLLPLIIVVNFLTGNLGIQTYIAIGGEFLEDIGIVAFESSFNYLLDLGIHLFYRIITTGFWFLLYKLLEHRLPNVKRLLTKGMWGIIIIICLAPLSAIVYLVLFTPENNVLVYPTMISSIVTIVGILLLTGYIANTVATEMENRNLRFQQTYYDELENNQKETAKLRHDMNNHLGVIATFIESGDMEEAHSYYASLSNMFLSKTRVFCKNSIVNAVINAKHNKAEEEQIDCFFNIDLGSLLSIDDISLCSIFANTLDNAIEACSLVKDISKRNIVLKVRYVDGYFSYEISNSKANSITEKNGIIKTSKKDNKKHGYGLSNVRDIVEAYNGVFAIDYTETKFMLNILITD